MPGKKPSKAQIRRSREELRQERESKQGLPEEYLRWLQSTYQPKGKVADKWSTIAPLVVASLTASNIRGLESLRKRTTDLAHFWVWQLAQQPQATATALTRATVEDYCRRGMPQSTDKSQADRRARLRNIADAIHPEQAPVKGTSLCRASVRPPYTAQEMAGLRRVAQVQPTAEKKRQLCLCVGLGAGAGIDSADLKLLHGRHVVDLGDAGIEVRVPGKRGRTVVVLREYEELVRLGVAGVRPNQLLLGRNPDRHNVAARIFERAAIYGAVPRPEQSRLRSTWLATQMGRPVPLGALMRAAGLTSARTLTDLLYYVEADAAQADDDTREVQ